MEFRPLGSSTLTTVTMAVSEQVCYILLRRYTLVPGRTGPEVCSHYPQYLGLEAAIKALHYAFPALCFLYFGISLVVTVCTLQTQSLRIRDQRVRRDVILALILAVSGTYVSSTLYITASLLDDPSLPKVNQINSNIRM
jgi:hypothetical protein